MEVEKILIFNDNCNISMQFYGTKCLANLWILAIFQIPGKLIHKMAEISIFFQCDSEQAVDQNESIFYKASLKFYYI